MAGLVGLPYLFSRMSDAIIGAFISQDDSEGISLKKLSSTTITTSARSEFHLSSTTINIAWSPSLMSFTEANTPYYWKFTFPRISFTFTNKNGKSATSPTPTHCFTFIDDSGGDLKTISGTKGTSQSVNAGSSCTCYIPAQTIILAYKKYSANFVSNFYAWNTDYGLNEYLTLPSFVFTCDLYILE